MTYWIMPSNEEKFRLSDFLRVSDLVDWRQKNNFAVHDIIFMYTSQPSHRITHQMIVERVNVPSTEYIDDREYWVDVNEYEEGLKENRFVRLRWIASAPEKSKLDLETLRKKGLNGNLQSAIRLEDIKLLRYIREKVQPDTKEKIARICWNDYRWERPSGSNGKSKTDNFENQNGFGHEEWLLDRKTVFSNGYHYAFLEPLRKSSFEGKKDIHLYSFDLSGKRRYVGCIRNAEYVSTEESKSIIKEYKRLGWLNFMREDLREVGVPESALFKDLFNVKFRFEDYEDWMDAEIYLSKEDPNIQSSRYKFLNKRTPFIFIEDESIIDNDFESLSDPNGKIPEGAKTRVSVNKYERSPEARAKCLKAHGYSCSVCGMNFEKVYGPIGKDFIHVHHIVPISSIGKTYVVDPVKDLIPVCPNCHAMLHHGENGRVLTVEELRKKMNY